MAAVIAASYYCLGQLERAAMRPVLGIETSCDETASAVLDADGRVLAEAVLSQEREHAPYGGVVPEIAARAHLAFLPDQVSRVMASAGLGFADLGGVAASGGPGLIGGLIVGSQFAKGVALAHRLPYLAVNHLEAHALTARLPGLVPDGLAFPYLLLLVSGGHCQCVAVEGVGHHVRLGGTMDDAAGEAFDKVARLLGLEYPGGPSIDKAAKSGDPAAIAFPRGLTGPRDAPYDFSFSGLKTSVARWVEQAGGPISVPDVAASFQEAVADVLTAKALKACTEYGATHLVIGGGVAANSRLRALAEERCVANGIELRVPRPRLCTDNGAMIAALGARVVAAGLAPSEPDFGTDTNLPVTTVAA
jgi:N6-L-threonylcarbamoyladenine synthase